MLREGRKPEAASMCGLNFCSMRITQDVRQYTHEHGISEDDALRV